MAPSTAPRVRRTAQNTQYTYNLPRRIHAVQTYPVLSPQGASILIYGHENGITIVWRGGRPFKTEAIDESPGGSSTKKNGKRPPQDAVMIIDSDEEDAEDNQPPFIDNPQFEDTLDQEMPYPQITQTLDLEFGTAVFHIATLPMTPCAAEDASWSGTDILKDKIVFAASCSSREVFLISLPLVPPSPASKAREELQQDLLACKAGNGKWGETMTLLDGQQKYSDGLAMTLVRPRATSDRTKSSERSRSASNTSPRVVVAAHSSEAMGALRLWDVPLEASTAKSGRRIEPFQTEYLPRPLVSISFNPTHSTQLLCNASPNAVRIYDYTLASMPPDDLSEGPFPSQGSWLISLYPPFARPTASRKPVLGASWIARGRAIFVLLADGQWGIWDIDGVSPQGPALFGKPGSGIRGDALTEFNVSGHVEGTSLLRNPSNTRASGGSSEFVPMTPHSRRDVMTTSYGPGRLATVKGGVTVTPLPAPTTTTTSADESVTLWIGGAEHVFVIPGVLKFWDAQIRKGAGGGVNLFSGAQPTRMVRLSDLVVGLMGERCTGVGAIVHFPDSGNSSLSGNEGLPVEVIVSGETRVVIVRESETAVGTRIGGVIGRRKRLSDRATESSAIIVHPRPEQPSSVTYNLSVGPRQKLSRAGTGGLFDKPVEEETTAVAEKPALELPARPRSGFAFVDSLNAAADVEQQDDEVERDVEVEMLDIMEIDRELDVMDNGRGRGRKKVIFDS
ncbi:hypothetical protein F4778DRAFT_677331 [Xylariomycetidae sp. FL2044]|nr:hypothetical protein F4778DRAFT_677331 [Xylariomycetidae sp. FL2044]